MDYTKYRFNKKEFAVHTLVFFAGMAVIARLFWGSYKAFVFLLPLYFPLMRLGRIRLLEKRRKELKCQFKDAIVSIADSMGVGYSVENAMNEAYKEMTVLYGRNSVICNELREIIRKTEVNATIEDAFGSLAVRAKIEEISMFAQIFSIAKRVGGNMVSLMHMISEHIGDSIRAEQEIYVSMSEKRLEQRIMSIVPMGIIIYVNITSPGFMDVMYETIAGNIIMTVALIAYAGAVLVAERMMKIDV